jgi:hypothetical protein
MVYEIMIQNAGSDDREWKLLFETGLEDPMTFGRFSIAVCAPDWQSVTQSEVISQFGPKGHCALMLVGTSDGKAG